MADLFDRAYFLVAGILRDGAVWTCGADDDVVAAFRRIWHRSPKYVPHEQGAAAWLREQVLDGRTSGNPVVGIRAAS